MSDRRWRQIIAVVSIPEPYDGMVEVEIEGIPPDPHSDRIYHDGNRDAAVRRAIACTLTWLGSTIYDRRPPALLADFGSFKANDVIDIEFQFVTRRTPP